MAPRVRLLDPSPENVRRGRAFAAHQARWQRTRRFYGPHAEAESHTAAAISAMFDGAVRIVGPAREYAYRVEDTGQTVRLNADNWRWHALDGTAEGRGLYELWAWRFGVPVEDAYHLFWLHVSGGGAAPAKRRKRVALAAADVA